MEVCTSALCAITRRISRNTLIYICLRDLCCRVTLSKLHICSNHKGKSKKYVRVQIYDICVTFFSFCKKTPQNKTTLFRTINVLNLPVFSNCLLNQYRY